MKRWFLCLAAVLLLLTSHALAETIQFQLQPDGSTLGFVITQQDGLMGLQTTEGKEVLPAVYKKIVVGQESILVQDADNRYGFLNADGSWLIAPKYSYANHFEKGVALVGRDFGYTLVDKTGAEILPLQSAQILTDASGMYYTCSADGKTVIWDTAGQQIAEIPFERTWMLDLSAIGVTADGKQGVVAADGKVVLPIAYDTADYFRVGIAADSEFLLYAVQGNNRYWFRSDGTQIGDAAWDASGAVDVAGGAVLIARNGKAGLMDMDGNVILPTEYQEVAMVNGDYSNDAEIVAVKQNGKTGLLKWDGSTYQTVVPLVWGRTVQPNYMRRLKDGTITVARVEEVDGGTELSYGLVGQDGRILLEPVYANIFWNDETDTVAVWPKDGAQAVWAVDGESLPDTLLRQDPVRAEILELQQTGILTGDADGDLRLWADVTRAEFLAMLARAENWDLVAGVSSPFSDTAGHWAEPVIAAAAQKGLAQGADGQFRPDDAVSYHEGFLILLRALGVSDDALYGEIALGRAARAAGIELYPGSYGEIWPLPREQAGKLIYDYLHTDKTAADVIDKLYPVVEQ